MECDATGHVISLQLDDETISGEIENSSALFSLTYLEKLNLADNKFNYTRIPRGIHNLTNLTHLNLSNAGFGGQIPVELSLLNRLVSLDISRNRRIEGIILFIFPITHAFIFYNIIILLSLLSYQPNIHESQIYLLTIYGFLNQDFLNPPVA